MQTSFTERQLKDPDVSRSNEILRSCVHCGFCTATCPTYAVLGDELDSPRGRIYLMKDMLENDRDPDEKTVKHIDRCLSCLACMTTCPSGVHYMHLVDEARAYIERTYRRPWHERAIRQMLAMVLPYPGRFRLALTSGDRVRRGDTVGWLESPETYPDSLSLTAPTGGRILDLPHGPSGLVDGWVPLADVASSDTLRLVVPVPPDRYGDVREGTVLALASERADGSGRPARRIRVTGFLPPEEGDRQLRATARVPNPTGELTPGMRVPVALEPGDSLSGHWLPEPSVLYDRQRPDRTVAFLRRGDGYVQVPVEVGGRDGDSVFVTSGVERGDTVVAQGSYQLLYADFSFRGIGAEAGEMEEGEEDEGGS